MTANVLALGEEADFEALNCQPSTKVDTRQNVQLTTEPAFLPNACYMPFFFPFCLLVENVIKSPIHK